MHYEPPGGSTDFLARAQAVMAEHVDSLLRHGPVVGVAEPALAPAVLLASQFDDGTSVTLGYGPQDDPAGPFVSVTTQVTGYLHDSTSIALADERDRIFERAGVDEPDPVDQRTEPGLLTVSGQALPTRVHREAALWAARAELPGELAPRGTRRPHRAFVLVVSRGVSAPQLTLDLVPDLAPYWRARESWLAGEAERFAMRADAEPEPEPASGIDAHLRLVELVVGEARRRGSGAEGRHPRQPAAEWDRTWEAALRAQMRLGGQPHDEANRSIAFLVNELSQLAERAGWWDEHGRAATAETIRYLIFDSDVPSAPAHRLWARRMGPSAEWEQAWARWRRDR